jgi:hypothetical protein
MSDTLAKDGSTGEFSISLIKKHCFLLIYYRNQRNPSIAGDARHPIYTARFAPQSMPCAPAARPQFFMRLQIPLPSARKFFLAGNRKTPGPRNRI